MELTAAQLAGMVNGIIEGNPDVKISTYAKIEEAQEGALSFLANPKYEHYVYTTNASALLVSKDFTPDKPVKSTLIRVEYPYSTIATLLNMVSQYIIPEKKALNHHHLFLKAQNYLMTFILERLHTLGKMYPLAGTSRFTLNATWEQLLHY